MPADTSMPSPQPDSPVADAGFASDRNQVGQNIAAVRGFYANEEEKISRSQRALERMGLFIGCPLFLGMILLFVCLWILVNLGLVMLGLPPFDPPPYFWLQGIVGLGALLTATIVLTKQNRLASLGEQRAHLDLKVTLLTEQKAAKLIDLLEELRRDLPYVKDRHDSGAAEMQHSMNPGSVLAALDEGKEAGRRVDPVATTQPRSA